MSEFPKKVSWSASCLMEDLYDIFEDFFNWRVIAVISTHFSVLIMCSLNMIAAGRTSEILGS